MRRRAAATVLPTLPLTASCSRRSSLPTTLQYPAWLWTLAEAPRSVRKLPADSEDFWKDARKKKNKANNTLRQQGAI